MIPRATKSLPGIGNIDRDFDVPDADVRQLKAALAAVIIKTLDTGPSTFDWSPRSKRVLDRERAA
jgi:hypothetical protein